MSYHLFRALERRGVLSGAVSARAPRVAEAVALALAFDPDLSRWSKRYQQSPVSRAAMSLIGGYRAQRIQTDPPILLQLCAWYDFRVVRRLRPELRCSYHDCNVHLSDVLLNYDSGTLRRTLRFERSVYDSMNLIMSMSDWLRRSFVDYFEQDPSKVITVGSGVNRDTLPPPVDRESDPPRLLFIGFDWERKGGPELLVAFRQLRRRFPAASLSIVGPSRAQVADEPGVRWLGRIDRSGAGGDALMDNLHASATMLVLPSRFDPFPNAVLEAMAWSLPVVATDVCGIPEMIEAGHTGLLVPPRDPAALGDALTQLAENPDQARKMGEAGRARVEERFTWDRVAERMLAAIELRHHAGMACN